MGERYWRAIASLLIASVILRRNDSGRTPGGADETDPRSNRLNRAIRTIRSLLTRVPPPPPGGSTGRLCVPGSGLLPHLPALHRVPQPGAAALDVRPASDHLLQVRRSHDSRNCGDFNLV